MSVGAYINFKGNCREAVEFYAEVFHTKKPNIMLYGDMPSREDCVGFEETKKLVMNASLEVMGSIIMFSDVPPEMPFVLGNNISLVVNCNDKDEIKTIFDKLKVGGTVDMELQETFWSKCYGCLTDKFGIGWQLNYEKNNNSSI